MSADVPDPPSRREAIHAAGEAVREARATDRDAILEARRVLRHAERVHDRAVRDATRRLAAEGTVAADAEESLAAARADRRGVREALPLLDRVGDRLEPDEEVLDMVAGVSAGHDGVLVATSRRVLFVAPRRTVDLPYEEVDGVRIRGRRFGARATIDARGAKLVVGGLVPSRAAELGDLLDERIGRGAAR